MLPQSALLLVLLLLQMRTPILAGVDPTNSHADFPYCRTPDKDACGVCAGEYALWQPCEVQARVSGSVVLPCAFRHSWGPTRDVRVSWHAGYYRSNIIVFSRTEVGSVPIHTNFSGRASLVGDPLSGDASLRIVDLRQADSNRYFCRVAVLTESHGWKSWQGIEGTLLNVTAMGRKDPTAAPPTSSPLNVTAMAPLPPSRPPGTKPQPVCGGFLLSAVRAAWILLALVLLGLGLFLARRRGSRQRAPPSGK